MSNTESVELHNIMNNNEHLANVDYFTDEEDDIENTHNHELSIDAITFEQEKKFKGKYPSQPIYSKDLYAAISKFRPTAKSLLNNATQMSNWLDSQKKKNPRWIVERGWDDDNVFTYLMWITPNQVENWIEFSDCVINDITHKTNRYGMPLSLFVGFDRNRQTILLAQGLLADESQSSHVWFFEQILKATNIQPTVIMTDSDPAVDTAVKEVFTMIYPIHCAFHIMQNLYKNLRSLIGSEYNNFLKDFYQYRNSLVQITFHNRFTKLINDYPKSKSYLNNLYKTKEYWAHSYIAFKFTVGMIAISRIEGMNACLKRLLYNSNISLCELMHKIHKLFDQEDKQNQYQYWKLTIPT
ncbi:15733_t:CDS:2, partial [Gigaspora margarita]